MWCLRRVPVAGSMEVCFAGNNQNHSNISAARRNFRAKAPGICTRQIILLYIQRLYFIEKQMKQTAAPSECRELIRRSRSLPIAHELHRFALEQFKIQRPASNVGQALGYLLNHWHKIIHCLTQGVLEIDTNGVENTIRPTKLGMRNWMFFGSLEAGANNALFYTLLANCRAQGLDPEAYLIEVIKRLPHDGDFAQAAALTPARIAGEYRAARESA